MSNRIAAFRADGTTRYGVVTDEGLIDLTDVAGYADLQAVVVGGALERVIALAEGRGRDLPDLTLDDMQSVHAEITDDVFTVLGVENSVNSRISYGGTAPAQGRAQIARGKDRLGGHAGNRSV